MKKIILLCVLVVAGIAAAFLMSGTKEHFGPEFQGVKEIALDSAISPDENTRNEIIAVSGKINRQCPTSGCWFFIEDSKGTQLRVELGHMGIKFPMRIGKIAKIEGKLMQGRDGWQIIGNNVSFGGK